MKKTLFIFAFLGLFTTVTFAVESVKISASTIEFYNYSTSLFTTVGMQLTVNTQVYEIDNLTLESGNRNVQPGDYVKFSGISVPANIGSVGLWYSGSFPGTPMAFNLASYVQYGAAGQAYETLGQDAGLWVVGEFVSGGLDLTRDADYSSFGSSHWTGNSSSVGINEVSLDNILKIGPMPFSDEIIIDSKWGISSYAYEMFNVVGTSVLNGTALKQEKLVINTALLEGGVYFIRITDNNGNLLTKRLIKQ